MTALSLVVAVIQAITFSVTINRYGTTATLRFPEVTAKLFLVEVCVYTEGYDPKTPTAEHWIRQSCWEPRFKTEELRLAPGTLKLKAQLEISEDSHHSVLHTPVIQVRPEPTE